MTGSKEALSGQEAKKQKLGYEVRRGTVLYRGTVNGLDSLVPNSYGEYGYGLYCSDSPSVISRYVLPQMAGFKTQELVTRIYTHHFRMDKKLREEEIEAIAISAHTGREDGVKAFSERLRGRLGNEVAEIIADNAREKANDGKNQNIVRAEAVKLVLSAVGYDGTAAFDTQRGGMILTFFNPEKSIKKRSRRTAVV